ncbi:hypothetical protein GQ53DRAFT_104156 [Thozetella sp. PMI_491]|nr:hypothetical protein GQ53DRAFT_104156 [Thozetella sp. PMI_491]
MSSSSSDPPSGAIDKSNVTVFLVPLAAVVVIGFVCLWLQRRHRQRKLARQRRLYSLNHNHQARREMAERDLEAAWVRGASRRGGLASTGTPAPVTGRRPRANRWAWANSSRLPEEGLNELGEAPPPYDPNGRDSINKDEVVETTTARAGGPSTDGGSRPDAGPGGATSGQSSDVASPPPPGYEVAGAPEPITRPPPAFVASTPSRTAP